MKSIKINLTIDSVLLSKARKFAAKKGISVGELVSCQLKKAMRERKGCNQARRTPWHACGVASTYDGSLRLHATNCIIDKLGIVPAKACPIDRDWSQQGVSSDLKAGIAASEVLKELADRSP